MLRGTKRSDESCGLLSGTSSRYVRPTCNSTLRATIDSSMQLALDRALMALREELADKDKGWGSSD
jgi:hypothetical protein